MKTFLVDMTISIDSMNEEAAEKKLDGFLAAFDLKKNEKVSLVEYTEFYQDGEEPEDSDEPEAPKVKKETVAEVD